MEATSDCGAYVMTHGALAAPVLSCSKICNDLRLLSGPRTGLNELTYLNCKQVLQSCLLK
ncbi:lyase family protein [Vibrio chagasii]|nr:lyase family protein [Vibrio chagasii]